MGLLQSVFQCNSQCLIEFVRVACSQTAHLSLCWSSSSAFALGHQLSYPAMTHPDS